VQPLLLAAPGLFALVWDPARWLWLTWRDPSYESDGALVAAAVAALLVLSWRSGPASCDPRAPRRAAALFALTAAIRLLGRWLAVDTIGSVALAVDVAALAMLIGVDRRPFALRPAALGAFFMLSLPVEHLVQRLLGFPLQLLAARAAELLLRPFAPELTRAGVLLVHPAVQLAVDLPCSGARGLVLYAAIALCAACCRELGARGAVRATLAVAAGALAANTARIIALFACAVSGLPATEEPWHSGLGAAVLGLGALPLCGVLVRTPARRPQSARGMLRFAPRRRSRSAVRPWVAALGASAIGVAVSAAPHHPLDVTAPDRTVALPAVLGPFAGIDVPLREVERRYYEDWGGAVAKRVYDDGAGVPHTALLVRTRAPLRHLHGPDRCLIGAGHAVTRVGVVPGAVPTVLYRSVAPDGTAWRVEASFVSDRGERASSVSEVIWRWQRTPGAAWSLVERISPWPACEIAPERCRSFDRALFASLDLPLPAND
jgi:exosortase/archaeosortase family protein